MKRSTKVLSLLLIASIFFTFLPSSMFAAALKIVAIKDLTASVYVNQSYTLPSTVNATMSNKTIQKVAVVWNPKTVVTTKTGIFVYKGTVKGYARQVLLTLKVLPVNKEVQRAISYGFVPKEIQGDWGCQITYAQYCTMISNMIARYDKKLVTVWKKGAPTLRKIWTVRWAAYRYSLATPMSKTRML